MREPLVPSWFGLHSSCLTAIKQDHVLAKQKKMKEVGEGEKQEGGKGGRRQEKGGEGRRQKEKKEKGLPTQQSWHIALGIYHTQSMMSEHVNLRFTFCVEGSFWILFGYVGQTLTHLLLQVCACCLTAQGSNAIPHSERSPQTDQIWMSTTA